MRKLLLFAVLFSVGASLNAAFATTQIPGPFDARSVGLGGTGTAYARNGSAIFLNPAGLQQIDRFSLTLDFTPFIYKTQIPLTGPDSKFDSETSMAPLFFAGGAYRLGERVVIGLGCLTPAGFGIDLEDLPGDGGNLKSTLTFFEFSLPVSVSLLPNLDLGIEWRASYVKHSIHQHVDMGSGTLAPMTTDLSGSDFLGFAAGLNYRPLSDLKFGLNYRSKVSVDTSGSTTAGDTRLDSKAGWATPHSVSFGTSYALPELRLMFAGDLKYQFYSDSNEAFVLTTATPAGDQVTTKNLAWKNAVAFGLGSEYQVTGLVALRLGYSLTESAVPPGTAGFIGPPPGWFHAVHAGVGLSFTRLDLDLGGYYMFGSAHVATGTADNAGPGTYSLASTVLSTSVNYHF